jgi:hypothetical protein
MRGWVGWLLLGAFVVGWDLVAAVTNNESLTIAFRHGVAQTAWKWPVLVIAVLLLVHLFLPPRLWKYDPLDRTYKRVSTAFEHHVRAPKTEPFYLPPPSDPIVPAGQGR